MPVLVLLAKGARGFSSLRFVLQHSVLEKLEILVLQFIWQKIQSTQLANS